MAEISAVTDARAAVLRNDTCNLRRQELRNAERLKQVRQADLDKRARIIEDQLSLDRRWLDTRRDDLSREDANRRPFRAQGLDVERALPPLTPSEPIGGLITPEELEIQRQLAEPDRPPPVGLPPREDRLAPPTPFESPGVAAIDDFEPAPAAGQNEELTFALQERERALRVNERRAEEIDSQVRQEVDLQLA